MALSDCIAEIVEASGKTLKAADARRVMEQIDARAQRLIREKGLDDSAAYRSAGEQLIAEQEQAALIEHHNRLMNLAKREARRARLMETATALGGKDGPDLALALRNQIVAINAPVAGGRASAERFFRTRQAEYAGAVTADLQKVGLLKAFESGALREKWARELFELSQRDAGNPAEIGVTRSPEAQKIAEILVRHQNLARTRLNEQGAWIGDYAGYITRTAHDPDKIRRATLEGWRAFIEPHLDERTFDGVESRDKFFENVYHGLYTGIHLSDAGGVGMKDPAFTGPANMAKATSTERVLHFRDAEGWLAYQQKFGTGTLEEQFMGSLMRAARQEALMSRFGTNPRAEFDADMRWLAEEQRNLKPDAVTKLQAKRPELDTLFDYLDGTANRPVNALGAEIGAGLRAISSMAHLGGVAFTHISAIATKGAELRYQGVGFLERYGAFFKDLFHGLEGPERQRLADLMLAGVELHHGGMMSQITAGDTLHGQMAKTTNRFFQLTGLNYLLRGQKNGAAGVIARHLGSMVDREFDALPPETQRAFRQYDITPGDWDALRTAADHHQIDGRTFLTPDAANRAAGDLSRQERDALGMKLHSYLADVADRSVITPGIAERADMIGGHRAGTPIGETLRFMAQFKTWGMAAVRQGVGREINGGQGVAGAVSGMMQLAVAAMLAGYTTTVLKSFMKGLTPPPPNSPATWAAALIQGGGYGILSDYLFGEFNRAGGSIADTLLGPVLGSNLVAVNTIRQSVFAAIGGDAHARKDLPPELLRLTMNNTPFVNLFYVRSALNYLFLHSLQETMNPGYLGRMQRNLQAKQGQHYLSPSTPMLGWMNPQSHLHTFGK